MFVDALNIDSPECLVKDAEVVASNRAVCTAVSESFLFPGNGFLHSVFDGDQIHAATGAAVDSEFMG